MKSHQLYFSAPNSYNLSECSLLRAVPQLAFLYILLLLIFAKASYYSNDKETA